MLLRVPPVTGTAATRQHVLSSQLSWCMPEMRHLLRKGRPGQESSVKKGGLWLL